ncbi:MAG: YlxR family protein [Actinomycetota bacterium]|nr:YlxR family protein [Actinomycetota bacterium]
MAAPARTCIGCRRVAPPAELVRLVRAPDGTLAVGRSLPGRGAWLCVGSPRCVDLAERRKAFSRALRGPVEAAAVEALRAQLRERARIGDGGNRRLED